MPLCDLISLCKLMKNMQFLSWNFLSMCGTPCISIAFKKETGGYTPIGCDIVVTSDCTHSSPLLRIRIGNNTNLPTHKPLFNILPQSIIVPLLRMPSYRYTHSYSLHVIVIAPLLLHHYTHHLLSSLPVSLSPSPSSRSPSSPSPSSLSPSSSS